MPVEYEPHTPSIRRLAGGRGGCARSGTVRRRLVTAALLLAGCSSGPDASPDALPASLPLVATVPRTIVSSEPSCARCRLTLEHVVRLGGPDGPEGLGGTARMVRRDSRGHYLVVDVNTAARQLFVFAPDGRHLRTIGGRGQGPGEFRFISQVFVMPGDSLRLHDLANARFTVYGPDHAFIRTEPYAPVGYLSTLLLPDGRMITTELRRRAAGGRGSPSDATYPVHILDSAGTPIRSFGLERPDSVAARTPMRTLAMGADGLLHVTHTQAYVIEIWDTLGVKRRELVRDAPWFRPWVSNPRLATREPRHPLLGSTHLDERGRMWTASVVMQPGWERHIEPAPEREGEPSGGLVLGGVTMNDVNDTVVEVLDLATGRLIVSQRFDPALYTFLGDGLIVADGEDAALNSYVDIWRLRLIEP